MMNSKALLAIIACSATHIVSAAATFTVDFTGFLTANEPYYTPQDIQGLRFSSAHFHVSDTSLPPGNSFGGQPTPTGFLYVDGPLFGFPVTVTKSGDGRFSVYSLDASHLFRDGVASARENLPNADFLRLVGNSGSGMVTASLPLRFGFTSFSLQGFTDLDSLVISGFVVGGTQNASWAVDNIVFSPIPETSPTIMLLLGLGALLVLKSGRTESSAGSPRRRGAA
jgi:hypothetical protein